jgi:hypothetical protein
MQIEAFLKGFERGLEKDAGVIGRLGAAFKGGAKGFARGLTQGPRQPPKVVSDEIVDRSGKKIKDLMPPKKLGKGPAATAEAAPPDITASLPTVQSPREWKELKKNLSSSGPRGGNLPVSEGGRSRASPPKVTERKGGFGWRFARSLGKESGFLFGFLRGLEKCALKMQMPGLGGTASTVRLSGRAATDISKGQRLARAPMSGVPYTTSQKSLTRNPTEAAGYFKPSMKPWSL